MLMLKIREMLSEREFNYICINMYNEVFRLVKWEIEDSGMIQETIDNIFKVVLDEVKSNRCGRKNCKQMVYRIAKKEIKRKNRVPV